MTFIIAGMFIGVGLSVGGSELLIESQSVEDEDPIYFSTPGVLHGNVYTWGMNKRENISTQARIYEPDRVEWTKRNYIEGRSTISEAWWNFMPEIVSERTETRILPYQVNMPEQLMGVHVSNTSDIDSIQDLDGKNVATPEFQRNFTFLPTKVILKKEYGVEINTPENLTYSAPKNQEIETLEKDRVDAIISLGTKRLDESHKMRPVFLPFKEMEEKFGDAALHTFFIARNDSRSIELGKQALEEFQRSSKVAHAERDVFMEVYSICNEFMVESDRPQIEPMTDSSEKQLQYLMDSAYEQGELNRRINISKRLVK